MASRSGNMRRGPTPASLALSTSNLGESVTTNNNAGASGSGNNNYSNSNSNISNSSNNNASGAGQHGRVNVSLEEWERNTPLTELQQRSVNLLMKWNESGTKPMPLKFAEEPGPPTPIAQHRLLHQAQQKDSSGSRSPISRSSTPNAGAYRPEHALLHPAHAIQTPQQFYDWFALVDRSVAHSQEAHYRAHVAGLAEHLAVCDLLLERVEMVEREVAGMMDGWRGVEEGGKSLKGACERLLEERDALVELVDDIGGHLEYFQELEHATRMLNHPGESLIFQADFLYMVERVDICIDFLKSHRHYKEAEVYLLRFQQCMTRAMTLIKMNFVGSLRALSAEISKRLTEDISPTAQHHLLYTRFRSISTRVAPLLGELERRAQAYPDELAALLAECHAAYLTTRKALLVPRVMEEIRGLDPGRSELVELTREGCGYLKALCGDEWALYREFFATGESGLYQYLETLCDLLYDDLRPRILHEPRLTVLCEVCTVLQALMVLDTSTVSGSIATSTTTSDSSSSADEDNDDGSGSDESDDDGDETGRRRRRKSDAELTIPASPSSRSRSRSPSSRSQKPNTARISRRLHIATLLKMVLQDAQTRLFFKAQAVIQSEIRFYVPGARDLDLGLDSNQRTTSTGTGTELREKESTNLIFEGVSSALARGNANANTHEKGNGKETWYPTLQKTVWVLGQLRDFVKPAIFEDIAQEALSYCRLSLIHASELIASQRNSDSSSGAVGRLDGALFLVRHMLILKEVWVSLEEMRGREEGAGGGSSTSPKMTTTTTTKGAGMGTGMGLGSARALDFGLGASLAGGGVTETLSNMLSRTTSLLPEGLFASLGVTRGGVESDMRGVKLDIDHTLRKACEDVIAACSGPVCAILAAWTDSQSIASTTAAAKGTSAPSEGSAAAAAAASPLPPSSTSLGGDLPTIHLRFLDAVQRDLRAGVVRIRRYIADERTVRVLVDHVVERVAGCYERWGDVVVSGGGGSVGGSGRNGAPGVDILSSARLREVLREVCAESG